MNTYDKLRELCERISEAEFYRFYSSYTELNGTKGEVQGSSPLRDGDLNPSFSVNLENGLWRDYGTGEKGNIIQFIQKVDGSDTKLILRILNRMAGSPFHDNDADIVIPETGEVLDAREPLPEPKKARKKRQAALSPAELEKMGQRLRGSKGQEAEAIRERFRKRSINVDVAVSYSVGIGADRRLYYPIHFNEDLECIGYKKHAIAAEGKQKRPDDNCGVGLFPDFPISKNIVLAEGEDDALSLISNDIPAVCATCGAGTFTEDLARKFLGAQVTILYDNDKAGKVGAVNAASQLLDFSEMVFIAQWPEDKPEGYDVGDWFSERNSPEDLKKQVLERARVFVPYAKYGFGAALPVPKHKDIRDRNELRDIRDEIYDTIPGKDGNPGKSVLVDDTVTIVMRRKFKLCCTERRDRTYWYQYEDGVWKQKSKKLIGRLIVSWLYPKDRKKGRIDAIVDLLALYVFIEEEHFNHRTDLHNLNNCAFDLSNFHPVPHSPEHYFVYKTTYDYIPGAECPVYSRALLDYSLNDPGWIRLMWQIHGFVMRGDYYFQKIFWFFGSGGRNGKGTVQRVLGQLVSPELTKDDLDAKQLDGRFYKKNLIGMRLAITGDMTTYIANLHTIKSLSGGDRQATDTKGGDEETFTNTAKMVFAMNTMPHVPENENRKPIAKRAIIVPFEFNVTEEDSEIEQKFTAELSGIFNMAIAGLRELMEAKKFHQFPRSEALLKSFLREGSSVEEFIRDKYERTDNPNDYEFQADMWTQYQEYMRVFGGPNWASTIYGVANDKNKFRQRLRDLIGLKSDRKYDTESRGTQAVFLGIKKTYVDKPF